MSKVYAISVEIYTKDIVEFELKFVFGPPGFKISQLAVVKTSFQYLVRFKLLMCLNSAGLNDCSLSAQKFSLY